MKIHVLIENTSQHSDLLAEHGLSLLIEACGQRILFDTGASAAFADNAEKMGVNLSTVDTCVISHGHYDHGGGIEHFLTLNHHAPVWVSPHAFDPHFNANGKDIGLLRPVRDDRVKVAESDTNSLAPGIVLHRAQHMATPYPVEGQGMTAIINGKHEPDDFRHEQYLLIEEHGLRVLISGCSHRGILNIAMHFRPHVLVGGFHFMKCNAAADASRLQETARLLRSLPTLYYTGHCTGAVAYGILSPIMGDRLQVMRTGDAICLD